MKTINPKALNKKTIIIIAVAAVAIIAAIGLIAGISVSSSDSKAVDRVESLIAVIGEVTLEKEDEINAAEEAFNALKNRQQKKVENKELLEKAIKEYDILYFNTKTNELSEAIDKSLTEYGIDSSNIASLYSELEAMYNGADEETKAQLKGFTELTDKKNGFDKALEASHAAAVAYVNGFLEVNKDKDVTITDIGAIVQKADENVYHLFALTCTVDGEEKNVYASARFSGAPSLQSMLAYADKFYGDSPALETQDALKYGNASIDLAKVLSEVK